MRKFYLTASLFALVLSAGAQNKFDVGSQFIISQYQTMRAQPSARVVPSIAPELNNISRGAVTMTAFVTLADGTSVSDLERMGFSVDCPVDNMAIITGDMDDIIALSQTDLVTNISISRELQPQMNVARPDSKLDAVQDGANLPKTYKGTGIICGIYDQGVDPNHFNFMNADLTASRVKRVWKATGASGGFEEYATPERIAAFGTDTRTSTHGTHTTGCMAGAFNLATNGVAGLQTKIAYTLTPTAATALSSTTRVVDFRGAAPDADLAIGCGTLYNTNIVKGVEKIVQYAQSTGQPAVVNLSIGSVTGPHDGTDYVPRYMTRFSDDAIICMSAGNEGDSKISITIDATSSDRQVKSFIPAGNDASTVDMWASDNRPFKVSAVIFDRSQGKIVYQYDINDATNGTVYITTSNYTAAGYIHDAVFDQAYRDSNWQLAAGINSDNNRYNMSFYYSLSANTSTNSGNNLVSGFIVTANAGQRVDIVNSKGLTSYNVDGWTSGSAEFSVNSLACSPKVIVVGAYTSKSRWPTLNGRVYSYTGGGYVDGERAPFSSYGTLIDGRVLPDVCAPGAAIISSISRYNYDNDGMTNADISASATYNGVTNYWAAEQGTSMSCPIVTGSMALWLQADPSLTVDKAREYIKQSAVPQTSGNVVAWGSGKFDALAGIKLVIANSASVSVIGADENEPVITNGDGVCEVFVPNASSVSASVYNLNGQCVLNAKTEGNTLEVSTSSLARGVYVLHVNGSAKSERILVK